MSIFATSASYAATDASKESGGVQIAQTPAATSQAAMTKGKIKKVDKDAGKVTIQHGPIANLDMPGMTMVFRVRDPAMLGQVKEGDNVMFSAENVNGALTVTKIEAAR